MNISVKVEGLESLVSFLEKFNRKVIKNVDDELLRIVNDLRNIIIQSMRTTQKDYTKSYPRGGKMHHPSIPGNPPAIDSGDLIGSIFTEIRRSTHESELYITAPHASWLNEGTKPYMLRTQTAKVLSDGVTFFGKEVLHPGIQKRPFVEPALKQINVVDRIVDVVMKGIK